eukprot:8940086-Pyramimonas_sp.AAC.1
MPLGRVFIPLAGMHNVLNALGVITATSLMAAAGAFDPSRTAPLNLDLADEDRLQEQVRLGTDADVTGDVRFNLFSLFK